MASSWAQFADRATTRRITDADKGWFGSRNWYPPQSKSSGLEAKGIWMDSIQWRVQRSCLRVCYSFIAIHAVDWTCILRIAWLGSVATTISIFTVTEHHGIKEGARQTHYVEVREAVYHKSLLQSPHETRRIRTQTHSFGSWVDWLVGSWVDWLVMLV